MNLLKRGLWVVAGLALIGLLAGCNGGGANPIDGTADLQADILNNPLRPVGTVQGLVISSVDGTPITNAVVVVTSTPAGVGGVVDDGGVLTFGVRTDTNGRFTALNTPVGQLRMTAHAPAYQTPPPQFYALATGGVFDTTFVMSPGEGTKPDGSAFAPNENRDDTFSFPFDYDGNFFSKPPDDD